MEEKRENKLSGYDIRECKEVCRTNLEKNLDIETDIWSDIARGPGFIFISSMNSILGKYKVSDATIYGLISALHLVVVDPIKNYFLNNNPSKVKDSEELKDCISLCQNSLEKLPYNPVKDIREYYDGRTKLVKLVVKTYMNQNFDQPGKNNKELLGSLSKYFSSSDLVSIVINSLIPTDYKIPTTVNIVKLFIKIAVSAASTYYAKDIINSFKNHILDNVLETMDLYERTIIGESSKYYVKLTDKIDVPEFELSKKDFLQYKANQVKDILENNNHNVFSSNPCISEENVSLSCDYNDLDFSGANSNLIML